MTHRMQHSRRKGFTLIELSIVLLVLSLLMGGVFAAMAQQSRINQQAELKRKMDTIEQALFAYAKRNDKLNLPCPAIQGYVASNTAFGMADTTASCGGLTLKNTTAVAGDVPVRSLGLADEFAFDPWGNRFVYAVDYTATTTTALSSNLITATSLIGDIAISDTSGNTITSTALAVLLSHGPDGFGAYTNNGTVKSGYSTDASQMVNCHCASDGSTPSMTHAFRMGTTNTSDYTNADKGFDDTVRFYQRESFLLPENMATEVY
jgi:prepilin-type N-terminal cleavage/methylation domain-containing protein